MSTGSIVTPTQESPCFPSSQQAITTPPFVPTVMVRTSERTEQSSVRSDHAVCKHTALHQPNRAMSMAQRYESNMWRIRITALSKGIEVALSSGTHTVLPTTNQTRKNYGIRPDLFVHLPGCLPLWYAEANDFLFVRLSPWEQYEEFASGTSKRMPTSLDESRVLDSSWHAANRIFRR